MTKVHFHRASRPLPLSFSFFFPPSISLHTTYSSLRIERIANEWKIHVDAQDSSFLRTSKHVPLRASPPSLSPLSLDPPGSTPFCIPGAYHLRVRHPRNRSVSRNNTRRHGHPSTHTKCSPLVSTDQKPWIESTFSKYPIGKSGRRGEAEGGSHLFRVTYFMCVSFFFLSRSRQMQNLFFH